MRQFNSEPAMATYLIRLPTHDWQIPSKVLKSILVEDACRNRRRLFTYIRLYYRAVAQGAQGHYLLPILDATLECANADFRSVTILTARPSSGSQKQQVLLGEILEHLEAFRSRMADNETLESTEIAHALDALLIYCIRDQ